MGNTHSKRNRTRGSWLLPFGVLSAFLFASCADFAANSESPEEVDSDTGGNVSTLDVEANASTCDSVALDQLYEKAKDESGTLLWYYTNSAEQVQPIQDAFQEAYPEIQVDYGQVVGLGVTSRVIQESEAGRATADLGIDGSNGVLQLRERGLTEDFTAEEMGISNPELLPASDVVQINGAVHVLIRNTEMVAEEQVPDTWKDIANTEWAEGLGTWQFPYVFAELASDFSEDEMEVIMADMATQEPMLYQSNFTLAGDVVAGKLGVGVAQYHTSIPMLESGGPIAVEFVDPVPVTPLGAFVNAESPRKATAKLFIAWTLCGEGAEIFEESTGQGNPWVEGTIMNQHLEGRELIGWDIEDAAELTTLIDDYGQLLRDGGGEIVE